MDHPEKSKRKNTRCSKKWVFIIGSVVFLGIGLFGFLRWGNSFSTCFTTPFPSYADVEKQAAFELPPSAQNVEYAGYVYGSDIGCTFWVKFEIDSGDIEVFRASTLAEFFEPVDGENDGFLYVLQSMGWMQSAASMDGYKSVINVPHLHQEIFVDTTNTKIFTVYIRAFREWS